MLHHVDQVFSLFVEIFYFFLRVVALYLRYQILSVLIYEVVTPVFTHYIWDLEVDNLELLVFVEYFNTTHYTVHASS